jgi:putative ABC transport system permease protein
MQLIIQNITSAFAELKANKLRTFLSLLGVTIGIFCIITVFTLVDSLKNQISNSLSTIGTNIIYVDKFPWVPEEGDKEYPFWRYKMRPMSKLTEMNLLKQSVPAVKYASMLYTDRVQLKYIDNLLDDVSLNAATFDFNKVQAFEVEKGRYFTPSEMEGGRNAIIIGVTVAEELFGQINPIGKSIKMYDRYFIVIGVLKKQGKDMTGFNYDKGLICCYKHLMLFKNIENDKEEFGSNSILIKPGNINIADFKYELKGFFRSVRHLKPGTMDNFSFNQLSTLQSSIDGVFTIVNGVGFIIGFFSLLVGAFGIANIMFVTVKERTNQIGIKKALGAKRKVILAEFLIEAIVLCLMGGLIGIILVIILAKILSGPVGFAVTMSITNFIIGVGVSLVVGIIAGLLPAIRASSLNPVVAIRS